MILSYDLVFMSINSMGHINFVTLVTDIRKLFLVPGLCRADSKKRQQQLKRGRERGHSLQGLRRVCVCSFP